MKEKYSGNKISLGLYFFNPYYKMINLGHFQKKKNQMIQARGKGEGK